MQVQVPAGNDDMPHEVSEYSDGINPDGTLVTPQPDYMQ
jgi:hypothetical protein